MEQQTLYPAAQLLKAIAKAREDRSVIGVLYSSDRCPFCIAVKKEQLLPRAGSDAKPGFIIVEFDVDISVPFTLPDGRRTTARDWGRLHKLSLLPTLVMIDDAAKPVGLPLVGYASRDFYPVYLEQVIQQAHASVMKHRTITPRAPAAANSPASR